MALVDKGPYQRFPLAAEIIHTETEGLSGLDKVQHLAPLVLDGHPGEGPNTGGQDKSDDSSQYFGGTGGVDSGNKSTKSPQEPPRPSASQTSVGKNPAAKSPANKNVGPMGYDWGSVGRMAKNVNEALDFKEGVEAEFKVVQGLLGKVPPSEHASLLAKVKAIYPGASGTLIFKRWGTICAFTKSSQEKVGPYLEKLHYETALNIVGLATNVLEQSSKIEKTLLSSDSNLIKAGKIGGILSTAAQRTLSGMAFGNLSLAVSGDKLISETAEFLIIRGALMAGMKQSEADKLTAVDLLRRSREYTDQGIQFITDSDNQVWLVHHITYRDISHGVSAAREFARNLRTEERMRPRR